MARWIGMAAKAALFGLSACDADEARERSLDGQWALEMVRTAAAGDSAREARGVLVLGGDLRVYPGPPPPAFEAPYIAGRSYVDLRHLWARPVDAAYVFESGPASDLLEEAVAKIHEDSLFIVLAPHVIGGRMELRGTFSRDTVHGTWILPAHRSGNGAGGSFTMIRVPADAFTDSARARSRRVLGR